MKSQSFIQNAIAGLIISAIASGGYQFLSIGFEPYVASSLAISLATGLFLVFSFSLKPNADTNNKGQVALLFSFFAAAALMLLITPPISVVIVVCLLWIWVARSWQRHKSLLVAMVDLAFFMTMIDLALSGFSLSAAVSAGIYSQSVFMAFWSFFLTQAMIAPSIEYCRNQLRKDRSSGLSELNTVQETAQPMMPDLTLSKASILDVFDDMERFNQAHQIAEQSLDRLLTSKKPIRY